MDRPIDENGQDGAIERREAYRAAQRSSTNVFLFRRLKWGWPASSKGPATSGSRPPVLSITGLLVVIILAALFGYVAVSVWSTIPSVLS
jgi:hypothetical protein